MNHGRVFAELSSCEGVRQGDVLGSLLFSLSMRDPLVDCTQGLDCHVTAVMDDIYFYGPLLPPLSHAVPTLGPNFKINLPKSVVLLPSSASPELFSQCRERGPP